MQWYLGYAKGVRLLALRDVFHREWNGISFALKAVGVWAVVLTTIAYNPLGGFGRAKPGSNRRGK
eukprot:8679701-Lingulodinium_polyedra.AAC.1